MDNGGLNAIEAAILGLVEGITEYLPVSSTGHLILTSSLLGLDSPDRKQAVDAFNIVIQGGAILAVLGLYRARVLQMILGLLGRDVAGLRLLVNLFVAFLPAAVLGFLFDDLIERFLFGPMPVVIALVVGGVYMIAIDRWRARRSGAVEEQAECTADDGQEVGTECRPTQNQDLMKESRPTQGRGEIEGLRPAHALLIGLLQCIAMWPGTSRSMMTITGGYIVGLKPKAAAEFSFLLGLPTLGAATLYTLAKNIYESHKAGTPNMFEALGVTSILIGVVVAAVSAALAVKWLVSFLTRHGLIGFGVYRIVIGAVILAMILGGALRAGADNSTDAEDQAGTAAASPSA